MVEESKMPAALNASEKSKIVNEIFAVFRDHGYEGASIALLSEATGLGKSSLYHHFPRGKEQMAEAVLSQGKRFLESAVFDVAGSSAPLKARLQKIVAAFDLLYAAGSNSCALGRLAVSDIGPQGRKLTREIFAAWIGAIDELARESGMSPARSLHFAEDWIARVQGALILHSAKGDAAPYRRAMQSLLHLAGRDLAKKDLAKK